MDRQAQMQRYAVGLRNASRQGDWQALTRLDTELARHLRQWAQAPLSGDERSGLQSLGEALRQARQVCADEQLQLGQTLERLREGRDRWTAYAESADWIDSNESVA